MQQKVLVFSSNHAGLREMLMLADFLQSGGVYDCSFVLSGSSSFLEAARRDVEAAGFKAILVGLSGVVPVLAASSTASNGRLQRPVLGFQTSGFRRTAAGLISWYRIYRAQVSSARRLIRESPPAVLLFSALGPGRAFSLAAAKEGGRLGIPSLAIPVANFDKIAEVRALKATPTYDRMRIKASSTNRLISLLFPQLVATVDEEKVLFEWPPLESIAAQLARCDPPHRYWRSMSAVKTPIALRNQFELQKLLSLKAPRELLHVTGRPSDDLLAQGIKDSLTTDPSRTMVLCALPQLYEHGMVDENTHWERIHMLLRQVTSIPQVLLTVSLHPRVNREQYLGHLSDYELQIIDGNVADHIPRSGVLIAMGSSIIELALAAAVPVIDLVCWFDHGMYAQAVGLVPVKDEALIGDTLASVVSDPTHGHIKRAAAEQAGFWGHLDGQSCSRIKELMDSLGDS